MEPTRAPGRPRTHPIQPHPAPALSDPLSIARPIFIAQIEQLGGAERSLLALSRWLFEHGLPSYFVTYFDHCNFAHFANHPITVVALNPAPGARHKIAALRTHFQARSADAPRPLCSGYQPALHATLAGLRGFHDLLHDTPSLFGDEATRSTLHHLRIALSNRIIGYGLRSGGATIVNSEYLKAECRKDFNIETHIVRMGGLSTAPRAPRVPRSFASPAATLTLLSVSRIEANKRIDWLLRAAAELEHSPIAPLSGPLSTLVDWRLELAGKGSLIPELTELAQALGIAHRVHFRGFVSDEEIEALYARADLFLMPAVQGYGLPALEAIERDIPVLLHRESGVSDILLHTPWAHVFEGPEAGFAQALATAIDSILKGAHHAVPPPPLPTEDEWAQKVAELCHWL